MNAQTYAIVKDKGWIVFIMSIVDGWAMVRREGAMPFVIRAKKLLPAVERVRRNEKEIPHHS